MFAGARRFAVVLSFAGPAVAGAQGFEYAPGTAQYRVLQNTKAAQEVMGQKQEIESQSTQLVTVKLTRAAKDTVAMDITLDTIYASNNMGMPTNAVDKFNGMKVAAKISPTGTFYSALGPDEKTLPNSGDMTNAMGTFLPRLRATLQRGATWTDTTTGKVSQGGMEIDRKTVSRFTVEGDTTVASVKAWKIVRRDSTTMTGSGNSPNGPMTMEGTTKGLGSIFVSPTGQFIGVDATEDASLKIVLSANGMEIGVTQSATTKVEKVK
jgi:hypothetical protein